MSNSYPKILVIVVLYNGHQWLKKCCQAIKESTVPLIPFFVDNGSTDDSIAIVKEWLPQANIHVNDKNLGFGQANNVGLRYALREGYDYVFLLNQDAYISHDMIEKLLAAIPDMENPGIISPIHLNGDGSRIDAQFRDCLYYTICQGFLEDAVRNAQKKSYQTYMGYAAAWLLPIKTLRTIGGFDPIFFHYGEDVHYVSRVLYHKLNIYNVPSAFVCHDRTFFGNEQAYRKGQILREMIGTYLSLTRTNSWWFSKAQFRVFCKMIEAFFTMHWKAGTEFFVAYIKMLFIKGKLDKNIRINKTEGSLWL